MCTRMYCHMINYGTFKTGQNNNYSDYIIIVHVHVNLLPRSHALHVDKNS